MPALGASRWHVGPANYSRLYQIEIWFSIYTHDVITGVQILAGLCPACP
ncbi:MAG TPA: hypothetical protein VEF34_03880 [Syntrophobacteraceae bacterium]|nr:hypothetical protein [Syntrophobacteraceae bacterium]